VTPSYPPMHPARKMRFRDLADGLREAKEAKLVSEQCDGDLRLYCYTKSCVYDRGWSEITLLARGLILDIAREAVVATPFPKFFNMGERGEPVPDLPFGVYEKLDGSLIIIWHDGVQWRCATKGSFRSDQAVAAARWMRDRDLSELRPGVTYLAEYVGPQNRIVVPYEREELALLAAYDDGGNEWSYPLLHDLAAALGWRLALQHQFASISDLITRSSKLPATEEGFVVRFNNGLRLKVKGDEYRRIHALISRCTPLAMWEAMMAADDMGAIRQQLPEEFWSDFDGITSRLDERAREIISTVQAIADPIAAWSDKEVGLALSQWPETARSFIFPYRKNGGDLLTGRARQALFRVIRPTGNRLDGYTPSYAMNRVTEENL
jgi:RNA ligase